MPDTVPCPVSQRVTITGAVTKVCPFVREVDRGTVAISWTTAGKTLELHSLAAWLGEYADLALSHEEFTYGVEEQLTKLPGLTAVQVSSTWETAGLSVGVA